MDLFDLALNPVKANRRFSPFSNKLPEGMVKRLQYNFGDRASGDPNELFNASKDAAQPPPALSLVLKRNAWAVVAAKTRGELHEMIDWANRNFVPIVPRGAGTSGYGGAVPTEGGVVVDLRQLNAVMSVDKQNLTVTVEPGIRFWDLERALNKEGLALRQYPTSARGSTVGGWVATGGGGVGSLKYGPFKHDVVRLEMIAPDGELLKLSGPDLELALGAWGITGFIVEVTLKVRLNEAVTPFLGEFESLDKASEAAARLAGSGTGWHLAVNPAEYSQLVNEAAKTRILPTRSNVLFVAEGDATEAAATFRAIVEDCGGSVAKDEAARKAWDARFDHLNVKRLGPSVVVSEAVLEVGRLGDGFRAAADAVKAERQAMWAIAISPREMDLIYYGLDEERRPEYATSLGNSLAFLDAIKSLDGRSYNTGVLLAGEAKAVLGEERVRRLKEFKKKRDPNDVFNPGPVLGARMRGAPLRMFPFFMTVNAPMIKLARGAFHYRGGDKQDPSFAATRKVLGAVGGNAELAELDYEVNTCIFCANCNDVAPETPFVHWETAMPRGRVQAARAILAGRSEPTPHLHEQAAQNPLSYAPDAICPTLIPIARVTDLLLAACVDRFGPLPAHATLAANAQKEGNVLGKPRDKRTAWAQLPFDNDARLLYFADDVASYDAPEIAAAAARALLNADVKVGHLGKGEVHSGATLVETGQRGAARDLLKDLLNSLVQRRVDVVATPDANAARAMRLDWPRFAEEHGIESWSVNVAHTSVLIAQYLKGKRLEIATKWEKKAWLHVPEALDGKDRDAPAEVLKALGAKVVGSAPHDCGHGRGLAQHKPDMAQKIAEKALRAALDAGAEAIVTASPGCYVQLKAAAKKAKVQLEIVDLHDLVAKGMKLREGGATAAVAVQAPAEPEAAAEPDIPPDHFRVEFVKEKKVVAVHKNANILDAALEAGLELPFSCRAGSCDTCSARWEGAAPDQSAGAALTAEQQKKFVLTCIARPKGPVKIWSEEKP